MFKNIYLYSALVFFSCCGAQASDTTAFIQTCISKSKSVQDYLLRSALWCDTSCLAHYIITLYDQRLLVGEKLLIFNNKQNSSLAKIIAYSCLPCKDENDTSQWIVFSAAGKEHIMICNKRDSTVESIFLNDFSE